MKDKESYKEMNKKGQEYYKDSQSFAIGFGILLLVFIILYFVFN